MMKGNYLLFTLVCVGVTVGQEKAKTTGKGDGSDFEIRPELVDVKPPTQKSGENEDSTEPDSKQGVTQANENETKNPKIVVIQVNRKLAPIYDPDDGINTPNKRIYIEDVQPTTFNRKQKTS